MGRITILVAALGWAGAADAAYVILRNNTRIEGTSISAKRDGTIRIETTAGMREFPPDQVAKAVADQPAEIGQAQAQVKAKQYDAAITLLEKVAADYRYLEWDTQALKLLPQVYAMKGDAKSAVTAYEKYFRSTDTPDSEALFGYFDALLQTGQFDKLGTKLDDIIKSGPREDAARAQTIRGDVLVAQNQLENAVLDYLRTALLFKEQKEAHPEALFKAAETLEKLRDARAKEFYQRVRDEYPGSPYAAKAQAKL